MSYAARGIRQVLVRLGVGTLLGSVLVFAAFTLLLCYLLGGCEAGS